jgi:hypothetical protein
MALITLKVKSDGVIAFFPAARKSRARPASPVRSMLLISLVLTLLLNLVHCPF